MVLNADERNCQRLELTAHCQAPSTQGRVLNHLQVLVVEDEPDIATLLTFVLEAAGAEVIEASLASEALAILARQQPDILLCNLRLPDADGCLLLKKVRRRAALQGREIPAIAITSYTREVNSTLMRQAGFQHYLPKPLDPEELVAAIVSLTGRSG
ncbi:MAG: response regulator [Chroococcidiopsidaceae cyanobacterium CP_BM_RX_35]|nr:response regulator [Chroococcidiopsidaceae cyanobacterium CP_BM_RX_35]